jgi:hypothetical protein
MMGARHVRHNGPGRPPDRCLPGTRPRHVPGLLDKDARIRQFDGSVLADGTDGLRSFYEPLFRDSPGLKARILHRIAADDYVIDEEETTGVNVPGYPATMHAVVNYQVKDRLIHDVIFLT